MTTRKNPLADLVNASSFQTKPPRPQPVSNEVIERIAENRNFPSREAPVAAQPTHQQRRYRTGRDQHVGIKTTAETRKRLYKAADERKLPLGELLRLALDALDRAAG
jgi:hypothetical protein